MTFHRHETIGPEMSIKGRKQLLNHTSLLQVFTKKPERGRIRNLLADVQTQKTAKGMPVKNLKLGRVIRQIVQRLQDKHFEQQMNSKMTSYPFAPALDSRFLSRAFSNAGRNISQLIVSLNLVSGSPFLSILCNRSCRSKKPGWIMTGSFGGEGWAPLLDVNI